MSTYYVGCNAIIDVIDDKRGPAACDRLQLSPLFRPAVYIDYSGKRLLVANFGNNAIASY